MNNRIYSDAGAKLTQAMLKISEARAMVKEDEELFNMMTESIFSIEQDLKYIRKITAKKRRANDHRSEYSHAITV